MIFRVCEHYDSQYDYSNYDKCDECFICYEVTTEIEITTIRLKIQKNYKKVCCCDGWIHNQCLNAWYKKHKKCPICRMYIQEQHNIKNTDVNNNSYLMFNFIHKPFYRLILIFIYIFIVYFISKIYFSVIKIKTTISNN